MFISRVQNSLSKMTSESSSKLFRSLWIVQEFIAHIPNRSSGKSAQFFLVKVPREFWSLSGHALKSRALRVMASKSEALYLAGWVELIQEAVSVWTEEARSL